MFFFGLREIEGLWYELLILHVSRASHLNFLTGRGLLPLGLVTLAKEILDHRVKVDHLCDMVRLLALVGEPPV